MKHPMKNPHSTTIKFVIEPFFEPLFPIILAASISSGQSRPWPETCGNVGGLEHEFNDFPFSWEFHNHN
jgi:hypothetical protein